MTPSETGQSEGHPSPAAAPAGDAPLLIAQSIGKRFPGVIALDDVSITLHAGEVLSVIGENGAGKSTLMKVLAGVQPPDAGTVYIDGKPTVLRSVQDAMNAGVALIHQELNLADNLDIATNIFLGREPNTLGWVDRRRVEREAQQAMDAVGLRCSPRTPVSALSTGQQQMVEIAKAVSAQARILIMDEPTSSLSQQETDKLYAVVRKLQSQGVGIIYISHRLGEVTELSDRVTVLRDGRHAGDLAKEDITHDRMVKLMVGREASSLYDYRPRAHGETLLEVDGLVTHANPSHALSFRVAAGEIVGVAGLVGAGRTEMLLTLFGVDPPLAGRVKVGGVDHRIRSPRDAIRAGLALVPEDRKQQGLILEMSIRENTSLARLKRDAAGGVFLRPGPEAQLAEDMAKQLATKTPGIETAAGTLSGGNQQKVVLAKWLAMHPKVLLLDEPTRGIDIGAKSEIYRLMEKLAEQGVAVLFVSSEMEEVLGVSDRVLVMHEGKLTGELPRDHFDPERVMRFATDTALPSDRADIHAAANTGPATPATPASH
ncbi:sugar ABC transporter ATP-binding protein [Phycisphaeraceae bacterium D3-23]